MLMMAGYERYYQIARCFRDEDLRADRQPEFTQLDMEMSFVEQEDVIETVEGMLARVYEATGFQVAPPPWPRMTAYEAMLRYGSDKPDVRFGLEITDLGEALAETEFRVFAGVLGGGGVVRGLNAGARELSRKDLDGLTEYVQRYGAGGLVWAFVEEGGTWRSPAAKALSDASARRSRAAERARGRRAVHRRRQEPTAAAALGALRLELSRRFQLVPEGRHETLWVVDFPAFEWNEGERRWEAVHHPFTTPTGDFSDPGSMRSLGYDIVLDGTEIGGGSIRIHRPEVQREVFKVLGISEEEARSASASCSTRCATARRRTAASRSASTASWR
jgi:aspartyl-tRNA synthetase